jgi:Protein of unknown function (DUF2934)
MFRQLAATEIFPNAKSSISICRESDRNGEVADLAYVLWLARGFRGGSPERDLLTAVRKLRGRTSAGVFLVAKRIPKIRPLPCGGF